MKKLSKVIGTMLILLAIPLMASAQPQLSLGSASGPPGTQVSLPLSISGGTESYAGVNAQIVLPAGVSLLSVTRGPLLSTAFTTDANPATRTVIAYSGTGVFSAASGVLLQLNLQIASGASTGAYPVSFATTNTNALVNSRHALSNADGSVSVDHSTANGSIVIQNGPTSLPTVTTAAVTSITSTKAVSGGNVTSDGGAAVTARGVCWSTTPDPTTAKNKTVNGSGTGLFSSTLTGLTPGTPYFVKAYATNSVGTAYGNEVSFNTAGYAATLHVSPDGNCVGQSQCFSTVQAALNASVDGALIKLREGTYKESVIKSTAGMVAISGGWNATFTQQTGITEIYAPRATGGAVLKMLPNIKVVAQP